jgi:hypothetical protein
VTHPFNGSPRTRRAVLQTAAALFAPSFAQLGGAQTLTPDAQGAVLAKVLYLLAPNARFSSSQYERQVGILQQRMARDAGLSANVSKGIEQLNSADALPFLHLTEAAQIAAMRKQVGTPFWGFISNPAVGIYNNPDVWPLIGYEGPAFEKGGYLNRGVNDIAWLPK